MRKDKCDNIILMLKGIVARSIKAIYNHMCTIFHRQGYRNPMSPRILRKKDPGYESVYELNYAIGNKNCNNIALTGIFGSGKSSIIKTVLRKHPFKKVLSLSLSRFISKGEKINFDEKEVERSIFQHIIYKSTPNNTPLSKYKKIAHKSRVQALLYAMCLFIFFWSVMTLWKPEWIDVLDFNIPFSSPFWQKLSTQFDMWKKTIATMCITVSFIVCLAHFVRRASKFGIRNIKIKDVSFDVEEKDVDFNKLLEEVLYFLKAGNYNYVIFEDLDRIDNPKELFLKFREINLLLNESEYYQKRHKRIVFVYAIRDDVFQEEERTKFFDYIVPVVPVVDNFNVSDYLLKNYKAELNEIDDKDIMALGLYIGGMRQMLNVMNEYGVYKRMILVKPLSQVKLLAITIYKNLYPEDYSKAHNKDGCLYSIFEEKKEFSHILTENDENTLSNIDNKIETTRKLIVNQREILIKWAQTKNIIALIINEERRSIDEVIKRDDLYLQVETNAVESYVEESDGEEYRRPWTYKFSEIVSEVDDDGTYADIVGELNNQLFKLVRDKNEIQKRIQVVTNYSLQKIILSVNDSERTISVAKKLCGNDDNKAKLLHSFIRNGFIDDDYKAYLSFTYPGAMTNIDFEYLHSVLQGVPLDYNIQLKSIDIILKSLHSNNFLHESILNYSLLDYLIANKEDVKLNLFVQTARNKPEFIVSALLNEDINEYFYKKVFEGWRHCIREILRIPSEVDQKTMLLLFWHEAPQGLMLDEGEKACLNGMFGAISDNLYTIKLEAAIKVIKEYNLKFVAIRKPDESNKGLFDYVVNHSCFAINAENLNVIYGEDFQISSYSQVLKGNKSVCKYIDEHIVEFVRLIPETDTQELSDAIIAIINNKKIDRDDVKKFVGRQEKNLDNLDNINAEFYGLLFELDKIVSSWDSITAYFSACPDEQEQVVRYINRHVDELEKNKVHEENLKLQTLLLANNDTLSFEQYEKLARCFDKCFDISTLNDLEERRIKVIVINDLVEYNKESVDFFKDKSEELFATFIIHFFDVIDYDDISDIRFSNGLSLRLLKSELSLEGKKWLLDTKIVIRDGESKQELSRLVCFYYNSAGLDENSDIDLIVKAMEENTDEHEWKCKIDLINSINENCPYDEEQEERMMKALGGGYLRLNSLGGFPVSFDNNEENLKLLNYLRAKGHNVNRVIPEGNRIRVTFRRKKKTGNDNPE